MRKKSAVLFTLVAVLVFAMTAAAYGASAPTLKAPARVAYGGSAVLQVSSPTTPSVIMRRLAGASTWTTVGPTINRKTACVLLRKLTGTAGYEVVSRGMTSDVVTIGVTAQISGPQFAGRKHTGTALTIKGCVAPVVAGNVQLTFARWLKVGTKTVTYKRRHHMTTTRTVNVYKWVQQGDAVTVSLVKVNSHKSKWSYKWTPTARGSWKVAVSYQDATFVRSCAAATVGIRR